MKTTAWLIAILICSSATHATAGDVTEIPAYEKFLVIPLRIHVLTSKTLEAANCQLTDDEVTLAALRINHIWHKAGIHFAVESVLREPAIQEERYTALSEVLNNNINERFSICGLLIPPSSRSFDGLHLYLVGDIPLNGGYLIGADAAMVNHRPRLREVEGGTDHALSRVAARGLGIALGLWTRQDDNGLVSAGTNGIGLGEEEVERARRVALTIPGALSVADASDQAEAARKNGDIPKARRLLTWLSKVPGNGTTDVRKRLSELPADKP